MSEVEEEEEEEAGPVQKKQDWPPSRRVGDHPMHFKQLFWPEGKNIPMHASKMETEESIKRRLDAIIARPIPQSVRLILSAQTPSRLMISVRPASPPPPDRKL